MTFGMTDTSKICLGAFLGVSFIVACGAMPMPHEYIIDVPGQKLKAYDPKFDKPLDWCKDNICYAYEDLEIRKIKKYIVELENRVKKCEKK